MSTSTSKKSVSQANAKKKRKAAYVPNYPKAFPSQDYDLIVRQRVESIEELRALVAEFKALPDEERRIGYDNETTSLDWETGEIVGFSFAWRKDHGYYVPIRHIIGAEKNLPPRESLECMEEMLLAAILTVLANASFDLRFLGYELHQDSQRFIDLNFVDVIQLAWLADTEMIAMSLKMAEEWFLGWPPLKFADVAENGFNLVDPDDGTHYAVNDAVGPLCLYDHPLLQEVRTGYLPGCPGWVYGLDTELARAVWVMEEAKVEIDVGRLSRTEVELERQVEEHLAAINRYAGREVNPRSPKQMSEVFDFLGLDTGERSSNGISTNSKLLEKISHKHPIVSELIDYRVTAKAISSFTKPLVEEARGEGEKKWCRFAYHMCRTPTARLASGTGKSKAKDEIAFARINAQGITKPKPAHFLATPHPGGVEQGVMGWQFEQVQLPAPKLSAAENAELLGCDETRILCEGASPKRNIRAAFLPGDDYLWLSLDYSAQELVIPANLSGEPTLVDALLNKQDLHRKVAIQMFGIENYDSIKRKIAKALNFGMLFGGTAWTISKSANIPLDEAEHYVWLWWEAHPVLHSWVEAAQADAREKGYVTNFFGRRRYVAHWYKDTKSYEGRKLARFGDRTVVSHLVQGAAAEMMRIALTRLYQHVLTNKAYNNDIELLSSIHDECNFRARRARIYELIDAVHEQMFLQVPTWVVPPGLSVEVGTDWGSIFPFEKRGDQWVPKAA